MFIFDPILHKYTLNGKVLPSVTQITQPLSDYSMVPHEVLERKKIIGTAVHMACELHDAGGVDESTIHDSCFPYFKAYLNFRAENPGEVVLNEQKVFSERWGFAGTLDRVFKMHESRTQAWFKGDLVQIDLKTVAKLMPATGPQTAGYALAMPDLGVPRTQIKRAALQLKRDGTYAIKPYTSADDEACFIGLLTVLNWRNKHE